METVNPTIADSSSLFALLGVNDSTHKLARKIVENLEIGDSPIYICGETLAETINTLWKKTTKASAIKAAHYFLETDGFTILETPQKVRYQALKKFEKTKSEMPSFTDCIVMALADHFKTKSIFGFDEHFKKNGYERLGVDKKSS